jgi:hypothetical protein
VVDPTAAQEVKLMASTTPGTVAVGLARCSTDKQEKSIEDQEREIRAWAGEHQLELLEVYKDEAVSGSVLDRQGVRDLLKFLGAYPEPGVVVIWKGGSSSSPASRRPATR